MPRLTVVLGILLCGTTVGCMHTHGPTDGSLAQIKRQQQQRLLMNCVADNGGGVTGAIGIAVVDMCRQNANTRVW